MSPKDRKKSSTSVCISLIDEDEDTPTNVKQLEQSYPSWSCAYCTYINQVKSTNCDMCGNIKSLDKDFDYDKDDEWNEADLADIDFKTQNHKKPAQLYSSLSQAETKPTELLSFAVSLNSGRVALYQSSTGKPLNVNFDIAQVLTKKSADELEESHLLRSSSNSHSQQNMTFDDGMVRQVLIAVDCGPSNSSYEIRLQRMGEELKEFVLCYLSLREVEKKVIKESGHAFSTSSLKDTLTKLLVSTVTGTTERYQGGAKERAIQSMKNGCANEIDMAVINKRACAWCAKPFFGLKGSATYCSHSCAEEGRVRRGGMYSSSKIREQLFALEHGKCTKCKIDAHALYCKIKALQPAERLNTLLKANWKLPKSRQSLDRLLMSPQEHDFWQADHILAVSEGGGSTGLDNIRTLCTPCHQGETEKLAGRLKTLPSSINEDNGRRQMDIFSAFSNHNSQETETRKRKRVAE